MVKQIETWVIQNKNTGEYLRMRSGKNAWKSKGAAKNAWAFNLSGYCYADAQVRDLCSPLGVKPIEKEYNTVYLPELTTRTPYFDEQDVWELVNLTDKSVEDSGKAEKRLKEAEELLREVKNNGILADVDLHTRITKFLEG